jgi:hypothetical protein
VLKQLYRYAIVNSVGFPHPQLYRLPDHPVTIMVLEIAPFEKDFLTIN